MHTHSGINARWMDMRPLPCYNVLPMPMPGKHRHLESSTQRTTLHSLSPTVPSKVAVRNLSTSCYSTTLYCAASTSLRTVCTW
jgi:hypothetical protein